MSLHAASALSDSTMKTRPSSLSISGLILILLPVALSTSPGATSWTRSKGSPCPTDKSIPIDKRIVCDFVNSQQNKTDLYNRPVKRTVQLYSRASKLHVQIMKTELDARGQPGSKFARLVLESDNLYGRIKIRGENTNRYLCINKDGDLVARVKKQKFAPMKRCIFNEEHTPQGYYQYRSVKFPELYIGFSKSGRPRNGKTSAKRPVYRHFTPRVLVKKKHRREATIKKIIKLLRQTLHKRRA